MILLIKLIAAHLIGDFFLQSDRLCKLKFGNNFSTRINALAFHSGIQAALSFIFIGIWSCWQLPVIIFTTHFFIDFIQTQLQKKGFVAFITDQLAHYMILLMTWRFLLWSHATSMASESYSLLSTSTWMVVTSYIAVLAPTSILIKSFMEYENWMPTGLSSVGLPNAGKWIGYLERVLILTFIFTDNVEGIGFLLAAKSVFRFGELSKAKDIKVTEYVLIGTFASFTVAILVGFAIKWLMYFNYENIL